MKNIKVNLFTWILILIFFMCGFINNAFIIIFILLFHDFGHIIVIKLFKLKITSLEFYPFGGVIKLDKDLNTPFYIEFLIAIAGVVMQLFLFFFSKIFFNYLDYCLFIKYNIAIILFNLLPIVPLDGYCLFNAILNYFFSFKTSLSITFYISLVGILFVIILNLYLHINNFFIVFLLLYRTLEFYKNKNFVFNKFLLERYLNNYKFKYLSTKTGDLSILKINTFQYFKDGSRVVSETKKLKEYFNNNIY